MLSVLLYVDRVCISSAKGSVSTDLGLSETQMGWVFSAFALGYALLQTPSTSHYPSPLKVNNIGRNLLTIEPRGRREGQNGATFVWTKAEMW